MQPNFFAANRMAILAAAAACTVLTATVAMVLASTPDLRYDRLGVREIYPTKPGSYEWYLNATHPRNGFVISPAATILLSMGDGVWKITRKTDHPNDGVRMYVPSPVMWKNIEMTGYVKLDSYTFDEEFAWAARSGKHSQDNVCGATAYFGALGFSGDSWFQKKVFHGNGYTNKRYSNAPVDPLLNRWVGLKLIAYNVDSDRAVRLELWVDNKADNNWVKVADIVDNGGWSHKYPGACAKPADYIITEPRPRAMFRVDNAEFEFKDLSVREIDARAS
jgi:hypothetical protein